MPITDNVLAKLDEKLQTVGDLRDAVSNINDRLARIETLMMTEAARCPYRETISRAANNHGRLAILEKAVQDNRVRLAQLAVSGFIGGLAGLAGSEAIKALLAVALP